MIDRFYRPDVIRAQSGTNKQGSSGAVSEDVAGHFTEYLDVVEELYHDYSELVRTGVAKELARIGLPASIYTELYWKLDLHNLLHFLRLRLDTHAQEEIRVYAGAILRLIEPIVPIIIKAFFDYRLNSVNLSSVELAIIKELCTIAIDNESIQEKYSNQLGKRELAEFITKLDDIFIRTK